MSERIVDAYCPECENIGSAERIVRHEEGYDKVLRVCRNCNAEFYHSWDRDWLSDAKIKRLEAELEQLRMENKQLIKDDTLTRRAYSIEEIQRSHDEHDPDHHFDWDHIAEIHDHRGLLLAAVEGLTSELAEAKTEVERLQAEIKWLRRDPDLLSIQLETLYNNIQDIQRRLLSADVQVKKMLEESYAGYLLKDER